MQIKENRSMQQRLDDPSPGVRLAALDARDKKFTDKAEFLRKYIRNHGITGVFGWELHAALVSWFSQCQNLCLSGPGRDKELGDKHGVAMVSLLKSNGLANRIPSFCNFRIGG